MINRRQFLGSILALAAAPAIVRAGSLMKVPVRPWSPWSNTARIDEYIIERVPVLGGPDLFAGCMLTLYGIDDRPLVSMPVSFGRMRDGVMPGRLTQGVVAEAGHAVTYRLMDAGANQLIRGPAGTVYNGSGLVLADANLVRDNILCLNHFNLELGR